MFMQSRKSWEDMQNNPAGLWQVPANGGNESVFLLKAPTNVLKAIYRQCPLELTVAAGQTPIGCVMATSLMIADEIDSPMMISGYERHKEEQGALIEIVQSGATLFFFYDELSRSVAKATCTLDDVGAQKAQNLLSANCDWYRGPQNRTLEDFLDGLNQLIDPTRGFPIKYEMDTAKIVLTLSEFRSTKITSIGSNDVIDYSLDDVDEGSGLEQSVWQFFENLFGTEIFHSPQVHQKITPRELTDILAISDAGVFLLETKAMAILSTNLNRPSERRAKSLNKQIKKGIRQLVGAINNLNSEVPITDKSGVPIKVQRNQKIKIGIVMVSELLPSVDWECVATHLINQSDVTESHLLVLDLQELQLLIGLSRTPIDLIAHCKRRYYLMVKNGSAMIRTKIIENSS